MKKYFFTPRIGKQYEEGLNGLKTLIVGSHFYCPYHDCPHLTKECGSSYSIFDMDLKCPCYKDKEDQDYYRLSNSNTIEINSYLEGFPYPSFSAFTYIMLQKRDHLTEEEKYNFWDRVTFTNYIQHYWPNGQSPEYAENEELYKTDNEAFMQVVDELNPHVILVWNEAIKDCLISCGSLKYFGMINMPVLSVYLFTNPKQGCTLTKEQEKELSDKYDIINDKVTKAWIESLFIKTFKNPQAVEAFQLKTKDERKATIGVADKCTIKDIATLFKQLATKKILIRVGNNIAFGSNLNNNHKTIFFKYIKDTFDVPKYTNKYMYQMFKFDAGHSSGKTTYKDNITQKMKAVFQLVEVKDKNKLHR